MTVSLDEFMKDFTIEEHAQVAARTAELSVEELAPRDVRRARDAGAYAKQATYLKARRTIGGGADCRTIAAGAAVGGLRWEFWKVRSFSRQIGAVR